MPMPISISPPKHAVLSVSLSANIPAKQFAAVHIKSTVSAIIATIRYFFLPENANPAIHSF